MNIRVPAERAEEARALLNQRENLATGDEGQMAGAPLEEGDVPAVADPGQAEP